jgi:HSP90 family molecular chaperone
MLLEQTIRPVTSTGIMQTAKATIKATPKIFSFFADQTYSNKPVAITRELVANAIDAHTAAGVSDVPIEVWLPTDFDPTYRVRDQGIGMSHDFIMGPFMAYTDGSTKDNANDQIGGFGIGSKSPFAYTDQFTLRSVHQGTVSIYSMFIDEDGIPSVGLLGQKQTNEANGVEDLCQRRQ